MTCRFELVESFISEAEQQTLSEWFVDNKHLFGRCRSCRRRLNTRFGSHSIVFPKLAKEIQERIAKLYELSIFNREAISFNGFRGGLLAIIHEPRADTYSHVDGTGDVTCNLIIQMPENGGVLRLDGIDRDTPERSLHSYMPKKYEHGVSETSGTKSRFVLIFRFDDNDWENKVNR